MTGARDAVAAGVTVGYKGPLSRPPGGTKEERFVAAKKPANKAHPAAKKPAKPVSKKVVKKPVAKAPAVHKAAKAPAAKAAPAKKPAVNKPAAKKTATKAAAAPAGKVPARKSAAPAKKTTSPAKPTVAKTAHAKPVPARPHAPAKAPAAVAPAKKSATAAHAPAVHKKPAASASVAPTNTPQVRNTVPAVKSSASTPAKSKTPSVASRPTGKVAVAVTARQSAPAPRTKYKVVEYKTDEVTGRPILPPGYKPSPDEEYMNPLQQEYFRQRLLKWRADLVEESKQTIENLREEVRDIGDEAERATRETENSLELRTRDRYRKLIGKIDSTLKRLDAGDYGYCVDTGEDIGLERLEARLTAERTLDAQERWEHLQKQQGE